MPQRSYRRAASAALLASLLFAAACTDVSGPSPTTGPPRISQAITKTDGVIDLGTLAGDSRGLAVNADTQAVGVSYVQKKPNAPRHAFLWTSAAGMQDLTPSAEEWAEAHDINSAGTVVGHMPVGGFQRGFRVVSGQLEVLENLPGGNAGFANAVNDAGYVVGTAWSGQYNHAARWDPTGTIVDLGAPAGLPGVGEPTAVATDLNESGVVVGWASRSGSSGILPFRWSSPGGMELLPMPFGQSGVAAGVNDAGVIAGNITDASGASHAVVWLPSGQVIELGSFGGSQNQATAINNSSVVVGVSSLPSGELRAFVWDPSDGVFADIAGEASRAWDVSDNGLVAGTRLDAARAVIWDLAEPCQLFAATPSDPLLADPLVQGLLVQLGLASNLLDPVIKNRVEVGGHLITRNGVMEFDPWGYGLGAPAGPCENAFATNLPALLADPDVTVIGEIHTHPASQGTETYSLGDNCFEVYVFGGTAMPVPVVGQYTYGPGPSQLDQAEWTLPSPPNWPGYAMSPDSVWRWEASSPPGGNPLISSWEINAGSNSCF